MPIQIDPEKDGITEEDILELEKLGIVVRWPENFYKYYRINENFLNSVRENYLWLSQPEGFNDPFDARLLLDSESTVEQVDAHISKMFESSPLKEDARKIYTGLKEKNPELFNSFVNMHPHVLLQQIGICCFTSKCNNLLMWAHYADNHRGVCVRFDLGSNEEIAQILYPVEYSEEYPKLNFIELYTFGNFEDLYLTKSSEWKYEEEWRIVKTKHFTIPGEPDSEEKNYGKLTFSKEIITEVIFGCKVLEEDITRVIQTFKDSGYKSVVFKKAEMIDYKFDLSFEEVERI